MNAKITYKLMGWLGIIALLVQMNAVQLDYALFRLNQQEIARTLCEHKMPNCNGHCYLMKQIAKSASANAEKRAERFSLQMSGQYLLSESCEHSVFGTEYRSSSRFIIDNLLRGFHTTVDQPPRAI